MTRCFRKGRAPRHEKRTKKAKKMRALMGYPVKKLYPSLKQYAEDYCGYTFDSKNNAYGYYCNPNAFWDWYSIGGRWPFQFLVRDTAERINGERSWGATKMLYVKRPKAIYGSAAQEKAGILHGELMKEWELQHAQKAI